MTEIAHKAWTEKQSLVIRGQGAGKRGGGGRERGGAFIMELRN